MALSQRKRRFVRRMAGYVANPVRVRARVALGREQQYEIGGVPVVLPPDHDLPYYQRRDPTYDTYAEELVGALAAGRAVTVIDVGANVGDTAVAMLSSGSGVRVVAVEGSPHFAGYLRRNVARFGDRARVLQRFVGPVGDHVAFSQDQGTGGFSTVKDSKLTVTDWVTPAEILADVLGDDVVLWKSDVDGFDIHILTEHWDDISERCAVVWFEFDPAGTLGDRGDIERLSGLLGASGRVVRIYDNLGRPMVTLTPGHGTSKGLVEISDWLIRQRDGHVTMPYVDVWAVEPDLAGMLDVEHRVG